ncbi:hypothetical protein NECAME_11968 [Necator americanus]|uniref:Uncharacterized protein n=1 Tax=Necator americanus TaxID=51031 RepID=W2T477_NECAM|nr:hypothetical protein NECAME_11968 [Necator americanus]ETN76051.1 hypothetical protein NECAME_11968 [Necator americanus]
MQLTNSTQYISDSINDPEIISASGVIGRVYKHRSAAPVSQLMRPFECDQGKKWKVYQRSTIPTRKHYQKTKRVGDVIVEGNLGTSFYSTPADDWHLSADHGYDYIRSPMQTIFFAMGPSIKKGVVLPAFQNIEECLAIGVPGAVDCRSCSAEQLAQQEPIAESTECQIVVSTPSHIYRVLIACAGPWSVDGASCVNSSDTMVLSFIFPVMEKDFNCLPKGELLLDYTARLLDVELITGLRFLFPGLSQMHTLQLKTHITTDIW